MKWVKFLLFVVLLSLPCWGQTTTVTATITDSDGTVWANGTVQASIVPNRQFPARPIIWQGQTLAPGVYSTASMNGSGQFTINLPDVAFISPAGTTWSFQVIPNASAPGFNYVSPIGLITGANIDITTQLDAASLPPRFSGGALQYGYADVEVLGPPAPIPRNPGTQYYNVDIPCFRIWTGTMWVCLGTGMGAVDITSTLPIVVTPDPITNVGNISCPGCLTSIPTQPANYLMGTDAGTSGTNYALPSANLNANSDPCPAALTTGTTALLIPAHTNTTTTPTFQLCSLGSPATIVKNSASGETALVNGDIFDTGTASVIRLNWNAITGHWDLDNPTNSATTAVYLQYESPLDTTNGTYPTPCPGGNCIRALDEQGVSAVFRGPYAPTDPRSAIIQDKWCAIGPAGLNVNQTCTFNNAFTQGDTFFIDTYIDCGSGCTNTSSPTFTTSNLDTVTTVLSCDWGCGDSPVVSQSWGTSSVPGGDLSITYQGVVQFSTWYGQPYMHIVELRGTQTLAAHNFSGSDVSTPFPFASVSPAVNDITIIGDAILGNACTPVLSGGYGIWTPYQPTAFMASINENSAGVYTPGLSVSGCIGGPTGALFSWAFTNDVYSTMAPPFWAPIVATDLSFIPDQTGLAGYFLTSQGDNTLPMLWTSPTGLLQSIQFKNSGTNFGSPMTGNGSLNCSGCTFSGTAPNFTITTAGGGPTFPVNAQTTNYQVLTSDFVSCKTIEMNAASFLTVTLVASGSQPTNGQCVWVFNLNATGVVSVVPSGQNLNGLGLSLTIFGKGAALIVSDGINYFGWLVPGHGESDLESVVLGGRYDYTSTAGTENTFIGPASGINTGTENVFIGYESGFGMTGGANDNTLVGALTSSGGNSCCQTFVGYESGNNSNGTWTAIGYEVGSNNYAGTGSVSIGTSSAVGGNSSHTTNYLNIGNFLAGDMANGSLIVGASGGTGTSIASNACGSTTQGTVTAGGNNFGGEVTVGTTAVTSCAVSFSSTLNTKPVCVCSPEAGTVVGFACSASTTAVTATATSGFSSAKWNYICSQVTTSANPIP